MAFGVFTLAQILQAQEAPTPPSLSFSVSNGQQVITWPPYAAATAYEIFSGDDFTAPWTLDLDGTISGYQWTAPVTGDRRFHKLRITQLDSNTVFAINLLNRAAYGPTPDDIARILTATNAIGAEGYIDEQLAPELIDENLDMVPPQTNWTYVTATGNAASSGRLIIYFNGAGDLYLDDIVLVEGTVPEAGSNLVANGDFESASLSPPFNAHSNYAASAISTEIVHSGSGSLHLVGLDSGNTSANSFYQQLNVDQSGQTQYTLSFWYLPNPALPAGRTLTVRLSGGLNPGGTIGEVSAVAGGPAVTPSNLYRALEDGSATLADLRAWYLIHCVESKRQLLEVLTQFWENHFVTQHDKTYEWFDTYYNGGTVRDQKATALEWREVSRWRAAMMNPQCTFYDLLRISAESPAMIIYLDTVASRGDGTKVANENYARELLELFCNGVDNGYDQNDIVEMSRAWTGWTVDVLDTANIDNPLAPRSTTLIDTNFSNARSNLLGVWTFRYRSDWHNTHAKTIFPGKSVEARFGAPWAGRSYELALPARTGDGGLEDGYDVIQHLADLPYTMEFICVKLCRLFVNDNFVHGVYDYSDESTLPPEGKLVKECMLAWENGSPQGQLRDVLAVIFNSELFRSQNASLQKIKTPIEFLVSAIRGLRAAAANARFTASTDGYSLAGTGRVSGSSSINRMGDMRLFDRAEPNGYPETGSPWISAGTLVERIRFVQTFLSAAGSGASKCDPVGLLKANVPSADWSDAGAVADYFLSILYPAEGKANLDLYRADAIDFLNTGDDGVSPSDFSGLSSTSTPYDTRVRGMVALLMTLQRFQEQ